MMGRINGEKSQHVVLCRHIYIYYLLIENGTGAARL